MNFNTEELNILKKMNFYNFTNNSCQRREFTIKKYKRHYSLVFNTIQGDYSRETFDTLGELLKEVF